METPTPVAEMSGREPDSPDADRKREIVKRAFLFLIPFLMVTMMYATYMGTMHSPKTRDMPVAVVGSGALAKSVVSELESVQDGAADPRLVTDRGKALGLLEDRDVAGVLLIPADGSTEATVYTAQGAGASQAGMVKQILAPVAAGHDWTTKNQDIAPLPSGDSAGIAVLLAAIGMIMVGYVPLSGMMTAVPHLLALRRFLPLLAGWAVMTSTVTWLILGPIVGAVDGHYLSFVGIGLLATGAVGIGQLLFARFLGGLALLPGMLLWVVFGVPSSNLATPIHAMPGFFGFLHDVLPLPAAGEALRSVIYFDGRGVGKHLLTLAVWMVAALALALLMERRKGAALANVPESDNPDAPRPAMSGGPVRSKRLRYFAVAAFPLAILTVVVGMMSASLHQPEIRDMPVVVVGASQEQAEQAATGLREGLGDLVSLTTSTSLDKATDRIREREVVGVYVLPTAKGGEATLYTSAAAGAGQHNALRGMFQQIAQSQKTPLELTDIKPLNASDSNGSNSMYAAMSWIMSGFLIMAALRGGAPEIRRLRQLLPMMAGWAVGMAVWLWVLFDILIGAINGHGWAMVGFGALTIFSISLFTAVFTRTLGIAGVIPVLVIALMIGVPASGGAISLYMVPEVFRDLNNVLPLPAAVDVARAAVYFDGAGIGGHLATIVGWGAVCLLLNVVIDRWMARRDLKSGGTDTDGDSGTPGAGPETEEPALSLTGAGDTGAGDTAAPSRRGRRRIARTRS
ncbi:ABC transporter permease [Streptomyces griseiscabiei]|uniref:ABC transporter permease n=1 Tax=Streptomyces griseiscabiei TaxID=2993540 RepID=A0ABU4L6Z0_9ACTN|nr:ABC transporter permease [Streptomyces griseiscabiei]MBZ3906269.1 ABC transporter permease [Streptomyces griseiscabiei]MDX2911266.1 ABC transporter permease [Streptomyces griseiscabiei]